MSTTILENPPVIHSAREFALKPYVARVRRWCDEHAREANAGSFELSAGGRVLSFAPAEFALIHHSALVAAETGQAGDRLAVEAVGLALKSFEDLARLRVSTNSLSDEFQIVQTVLMHDGTLGNALLVELQTRTDELRAQGLEEQSRLLGKFKQRVWNTVAELEQVIAETSLVSVSARKNRSERSPSLTMFLALGLLVATLAWLGLFGPLRSDAAVVRELTLADFDGQLTGLEARPPSLFGSVDRARWEGLDTTARLEFVDQLAQVLSESAYSGALLRTEDGVPIAQWLEARGSMLLENRELP